MGLFICNRRPREQTHKSAAFLCQVDSVSSWSRLPETGSILSCREDEDEQLLSRCICDPDDGHCLPRNRCVRGFTRHRVRPWCIGTCFLISVFYFIVGPYSAWSSMTCPTLLVVTKNDASQICVVLSIRGPYSCTCTIAQIGPGSWWRVMNVIMNMTWCAMTTRTPFSAPEWSSLTSTLWWNKARLIVWWECWCNNKHAGLIIHFAIRGMEHSMISD